MKREPFQEFRVPETPEGLRERVLAAARRAEPLPPASAWTRVARSPVARLAWAAGVALLALGHLAVGTAELPELRTGASAGDGLEIAPELADEIALPPMDPLPTFAGNAVEDEPETEPTDEA